MAEPATAAAISTVSATSLIVLASKYLGVDIGPLAVIILGAWCGSFWALVSAPAMTRLQSAGLAMRAILLSVLMTGAVSHLLSDAFGWQSDELLIIVSIGIAALGDRWIDIFNSLKEAIMTGIGNVFKKKDSQ